MKVLMAQVSPVVGDLAGNSQLVLAALARGTRLNVDLVLLPEMVLSGYPPRDLLEYGSFVRACRQAAERLAARTTEKGPVLVLGLPLRDDKGLRNAAMVAHAGKVAALRFKSLLPTYDVFDELRYFVPESDPRPVEVAGMKLAVTICEDIWNDPELFPRQPYSWDPVDRLEGCDALLNLSASPFHAGSPHHPDKPRLRLSLCRRKARKAGAPLVFVNQVGGNDELVFDGNSMAVSSGGRLLAHCPSFEPSCQVVDLHAAGTVEPPATCFEEQVEQALTLGIRDYARRCGFSSGVMGLSGGIDSAVVCVLAARALGPENVHAVAMPGPYSSRASLDDARRLALNLGTRFQVLSIDPAYRSYLEALKERFAGTDFGVTEENLQARIRGNLLMAISNKEGHLLLTTGNKSELAVGYCTLYGDMAGGLGVISDIFKTDVYRLARWFNRNKELIPSRILQRPPSAELAPDQTDEASLMPYHELDAILRAYLEQRMEPADIVSAGHDPRSVARAVRLVTLNEYKRWQAAPGLRVSSRAFGMGRRFPLAQRWHEWKNLD